MSASSSFNSTNCQTACYLPLQTVTQTVPIAIPYPGKQEGVLFTEMTIPSLSDKSNQTYFCGNEIQNVNNVPSTTELYCYPQGTSAALEFMNYYVHKDDRAKVLSKVQGGQKRKTQVFVRKDGSSALRINPSECCEASDLIPFSTYSQTCSQ